MITALIIMYFFGGGTAEIFSRSDFRTIGRTLEEPSRAEATTQAMERINEGLASLMQRREQIFEELSEINARVDAPEDAYNRVLDELWQARTEARLKYVEQVFIMRKNLTRQEWDEAFGNTD